MQATLALCVSGSKNEHFLICVCVCHEDCWEFAVIYCNILYTVIYYNILQYVDILILLIYKMYWNELKWYSHSALHIMYTHHDTHTSRVLIYHIHVFSLSLQSCCGFQRSLKRLGRREDVIFGSVELSSWWLGKVQLACLNHWIPSFFLEFQSLCFSLFHIISHHSSNSVHSVELVKDPAVSFCFTMMSQ